MTNIRYGSTPLTLFSPLSHILNIIFTIILSEISHHHSHSQHHFHQGGDSGLPPSYSLLELDKDLPTYAQATQ